MTYQFKLSPVFQVIDCPYLGVTMTKTDKVNLTVYELDNNNEVIKIVQDKDYVNSQAAQRAEKRARRMLG